MTTSNERLNVLYSCRVRLTDEQRNKLKAAYRQHLDTNAPPQGARIGASSVVTQTAATLPVQQKLPGIVLIDLITTRDSIPLATLVLLEKAFGIELLSRDELIEAATGYIDYVRSKDV